MLSMMQSFLTISHKSIQATDNCLITASLTLIVKFLTSVIEYICGCNLALNFTIV